MPVVKIASICRHRPEHEFETAERCAIVEVSNDADDEQVSIARARVRPGVVTAWHVLDGIAERYLVISGTGVAEVGALAPQRVQPGDVVRIPPGVRQRITNTGSDDLVFYAICTPRFRSDSYRSLEPADTVQPDPESESPSGGPQ